MPTTLFIINNHNKIANITQETSIRMRRCENQLMQYITVYVYYCILRIKNFIQRHGKSDI